MDSMTPDEVRKHVDAWGIDVSSEMIPAEAIDDAELRPLWARLDSLLDEIFRIIHPERYNDAS